MKAHVFVNHIKAGTLEKINDAYYRFSYDANYKGQAVSLTMPISQTIYEFQKFPAFFEGLLPEGIMLEAMLRIHKLDKDDYFGQLLKVGCDVVGAVTIEECK
jgi:serine/threonine-protein kinase HipA